MKPVDFSLENWESVKARLKEQREAAWHVWLAHGPGTTEEVAARAGWDWRSLRPRTTELLQAGFVVLQGRCKAAKAGIYRACSEAEALDNFRRAQARLASGQLSLDLRAHAPAA